MTSYDKAERPKMTGEDTAVDDGALDSVFASDRDRGGKTAPPEPAPKEPAKATEPAEKPAGTEPAPDGTDPSAEKRDPFQQYRDPESGKLVPLNALHSEREKRQEAAKRAEEAEKRAKDLEAKFSDLERRLQAAQQPPPQHHQQPQQRQPQQLPPRPDHWTDPEGAAAWDRHVMQMQFAEREKQMQMDAFETRVATSEHLMSAVPDFEQMKAVFLDAARADHALAQKMVRHPLPAKFAYEEGKRLAAQREVGTDIDAFKKKIFEEAKAQVLEELKAGTKANAQPQKFPATLADATPSGDQGAHLTDEAVMGAVFASGRRRK